MDIVKKVPEDVDEMRVAYESKNPREGTCGPTLVAFFTGKTVKEIIDNWSIPYRGYCSLRELEREINKYQIMTQRIRAEVKDQFVLPLGVNQAIARIQWKGKYSHWMEAEKNTHFIFFEADDKTGGIHLFDNTEGWFEPEWPVGIRTMKEGKITSFLTIQNG